MEILAFSGSYAEALLFLSARLCGRIVPIDCTYSLYPICNEPQVSMSGAAASPTLRTQTQNFLPLLSTWATLRHLRVNLSNPELMLLPQN